MCSLSLKYAHVATRQQKASTKNFNHRAAFLPARQDFIASMRLGEATVARGLKTASVDDQLLFLLEKYITPIYLKRIN
jgi:hypothetical protein